MRMSRLGKGSGRWSVVSGQSVSFKVILLFISLLLTPHSSVLTEVRADEYHYNNILIGDRAAGMGGAYTAIADDPSGLYYNPAGIIYSIGNNLSASVNAYSETRTVYNDVKGVDWKRKSAALLPNYFGIIQPLGKGRVGFSYAVPDTILEDQDQTFYNLVGGIDRYIINFNKNDKTYNFGPSYAIELLDGLSAGITVYAHYRENEFILNQLQDLTTGKEWLNQYYESSEWGIKPMLGLMWNAADKLSLGLTVSQTKILWSETTNQNICLGAVGVTYSAGSLCQQSQAANAPVSQVDHYNNQRVLPLTTTLGVAYFPTNTLILSADLKYYDKTNDDAFGDRAATWNTAIGAEYYITDRLALRGGLFTDRANTKEIKSGDVNAFDHVDLYGGSLSVSYFTRQSSLTLGTNYRLGTGEAQILGDDQVQDVGVQSSTYFISAGYMY